MPRRVYYILLLVFLATPSVATAQIQLTVNPMMVKGAPDAPVTIVEFSDYQ